MKLNKLQILAANDRRLEAVEVPEWGGTVYLKTLSVGEGLALEAAIHPDEPDKTVGVYLSYTLADEDGKLLFEPGDFEALYTKSPQVITRLFEHARAMNQMEKGQDEVIAEKS
jgi:hypothetical protein